MAIVYVQEFDVPAGDRSTANYDEIARRVGRPDQYLAEDQGCEFGLSFAQFPPGDIAIAVGIEGVGQIEITNCEFELTRHVIIMHGCPQEPIALGMGLDASGGEERCRED